MECRRTKTKVDLATNGKEFREGEIFRFLHNFKGFLSRYGKEPYFHSRVFSSFEELASYLDRDHREDIDFHAKLLTNGLYASKILSTFFVYTLETKKDASQMLERTMKQIGNRISLLHRIGEKEYEKWYRLEVKESGNDLLDPIDISILMDLDFFQNPPKTTPTIYPNPTEKI